MQVETGSGDISYPGVHHLIDGGSAVERRDTSWASCWPITIFSPGVVNKSFKLCLSCDEGGRAEQ